MAHVWCWPDDSVREIRPWYTAAGDGGGLGKGAGDLLGAGEGAGDVDGLGFGEGSEGDGEGLGLGEGDGEGLGLGEGDGEGLGSGGTGLGGGGWRCDRPPTGVVMGAYQSVMALVDSIPTWPYSLRPLQTTCPPAAPPSAQRTHAVTLASGCAIAATGQVKASHGSASPISPATLPRVPGS